MQKTCLSCGSKITGRADKKYCNDACKNDFHNHHSGPPAHYERNQIAIAERELKSSIEDCKRAMEWSAALRRQIFAERTQFYLATSTL